MFDFFDFDEGVSVAEFFDNEHVCVSCEDACENARVFGEFDFVVEWREDGDAASVGCPEVVFAVSRRKVNNTRGGVDVDEVFADDVVNKRMFGFKFCLFGYYVFKGVLVGGSFEGFARKRFRVIV